MYRHALQKEPTRVPHYWIVDRAGALGGSRRPIHEFTTDPEAAPVTGWSRFLRRPRRSQFSYAPPEWGFILSGNGIALTLDDDPVPSNLVVVPAGARRIFGSPSSQRDSPPCARVTAAGSTSDGLCP